MNQKADSSKTILIALLAVAAIAVAVWSGFRFFGNHEEVVGTLGTISRDAEAGRGAEAAQAPQTTGKEAETSGGDSASGAPPEANEGARGR